MPEALTAVEVPGLRPRQADAQRLPDRHDRDGQGPDGRAEPAAIRPRRRRDRVHGQSHQPAPPPAQTGKVSLTLSDARTLESRDEALGNTSPEQEFDVPSKESRTFSWRLTIPDGCEFLIYKAVGATTRLSDGEARLSAGAQPQDSGARSRCRCPFAGPQTKEFEFTKLLESGQSDTPAFTRASPCRWSRSPRGTR